MPQPTPFFILDHGLNPEIARALGKLSYPIRSVQDEFAASPTDSVSDERIIAHIGNTYGFRGVWITKNTASKRAHADLIASHGISVIWIRTQKLSTRQQHRIITYGLDAVYQDLVESKSPIQYDVLFHGQPNRERITFKPIRGMRKYAKS